jgi:hypothetical protein
MVIVTEGTPQGTSRSGQEYVSPLLVLTGDEYEAISFDALHRRICDALRGNRPRCIGEVIFPDGRCIVSYTDGSSHEIRVEEGDVQA